MIHPSPGFVKEEFPLDMDYNQLLDGCCEAARQLLRHGAEIRRAEDTARRLLAAYGLEGEVFAVPNCIWASAAAADGRIYSRMRRVPAPTTSIEGIERFNDLSRRLCAQPPDDPAAILAQCRAVLAGMREYPVSVRLSGYFVGAFFFALFFSAGWAEAAAAGLAGLAAGACLVALERLHANAFITTLISALALGAVGYGLLALGAPINIEVTIAGGLMVLVPGLVFTSFMSDLFTGDVLSGLATFARAVLSAGAIAVGTGATMAAYHRLFSAPDASQMVAYAPPVICVFAFMGCLGFCPSLNAQGAGALLCCLGGAMGWAVYLAAEAAGGTVFTATLVATVAVAAYSEVMARVRKCPATSYLLISLFPLVPGLSIYRAMDYGIWGRTDLFLGTLFRTMGIAGCIALGLLLVSSAVHIWQRRRRQPPL